MNGEKEKENSLMRMMSIMRKMRNMMKRKCKGGFVLVFYFIFFWFQESDWRGFLDYYDGNYEKDVVIFCLFYLFIHKNLKKNNSVDFVQVL